MEVITNNSIELLLLSRASYIRSLSHVDNKLRSFWSNLKWMCVNQSDTSHAVVSRSLFLLLSIFIHTASHFVLSYTLTRHAYDVIVQLSLTSTSDLSYLCLFTWEMTYKIW